MIRIVTYSMQLIPKSYYEQHFERREDNRTINFRKLLDGAKKKIVFKIIFTTEKDLKKILNNSIKNSTADPA